MTAPNWQLEPRLALACRSCGAPRQGNPKKTFLGFQQVHCEDCGHVSLYPLNRLYRRIYWGAVVLFAAICVTYLLDGQIPIPGVLFFAAVYGLWRDRQIFSEVTGTAAKDNGLDMTDDPTQDP